MHFVLLIRPWSFQSEIWIKHQSSKLEICKWNYLQKISYGEFDNFEFFTCWETKCYLSNYKLSYHMQISS